jgi:DNA-binding beta-propeller fold protein YncE
VVIDGRGIASTGTVSRIDIATQKVTHTLATGLHPPASTWDHANRQARRRQSNSDTVTVIDTRTQATVRAPIRAAAVGAEGERNRAERARRGAGDAALSPGGGINAVLVIDAATGAPKGSIPTAWYPNAPALSPGREAPGRLGALLGAGSGWRDQPTSRYVHATPGFGGRHRSAGVLAQLTNASRRR